MRAQNLPPSADAPLSTIYQEWVNTSRFSPDDLSRANSMMTASFQTLLNANITQLSTLRCGKK